MLQLTVRPRGSPEVERIISWKLCKSKTEGIFGRNMGKMGVMVEDAFLDIRGHIRHTILYDMARMSTVETDTIMVFYVAPFKIIISCSWNTPFATIMMCLVWVQEAFFFDGAVNGRKGRLLNFIIFEFFTVRLKQVDFCHKQGSHMVNFNMIEMG